MDIKFFCPHWGSNHLELSVFFDKVRSEGYDGVEMSLPPDKAKKNEILEMIKNRRLLLIAQHWETTTSDYAVHTEQYRTRLINLAEARPLFINAHTGKDFFTFEQNAGLIRIASEVSRDYDVKIVHETHRGRFSFASHITSQFLSHLPDLRIVLDVSHWCNVAESFLDDQQQSVELAISRADHIHARVGFPEGPQVPDPRVPEWKEALEIHLGWWKRIIQRAREEGREEFTITSEFGPFPYMTILPFTRQPVADQWEVNAFMKNLLKSELRN